MGTYTDLYNQLQDLDESLPKAAKSNRVSGFRFDPTPESQPYLQAIRDAEQKYGIPENLVARMIQQESAFNPKAVSPKGARGIAQIMSEYHPDAEPDDPFKAIDYSAKYLRQNADRFAKNGDPDFRLGLAAYNAGPGNVKKYGDVPPFGETQDYVKRIYDEGRVQEPAAPAPVETPKANTYTELYEGLSDLGEERPGFIKSTFGDVVGGILDLGEMYGRGGRVVPGGDRPGLDEGGYSSSIIKWADRVRQDNPWLDNDLGRTGFSRWFHQGLRSAVTSMAAGAPGAAAGAAIGTMINPGVGSFVGGVLGYALGGGTLFGVAEYDQVLEDATAAGIPMDVAEPAALRSALYEGGFEFAADILEGALLGTTRIIRPMAKEALKQGVASMFKANIRQIAKQTAGMVAIETGSEMLTGGLQAEEAFKIGLGNQRFMEAAIDAFGPSLVASMIFGGVAQVGRHRLSKRIQNHLANPEVDPKKRVLAAQAVAEQIKPVSESVSDVWYDTALQAIDANEGIDLDAPVLSDPEIDARIANDEQMAEATAAAAAQDMARPVDEDLEVAAAAQAETGMGDDLANKSVIDKMAAAPVVAEEAEAAPGVPEQPEPGPQWEEGQTPGYFDNRTEKITRVAQAEGGRFTFFSTDDLKKKGTRVKTKTDHFYDTQEEAEAALSEYAAGRKFKPLAQEDYTKHRVKLSIDRERQEAVIPEGLQPVADLAEDYENGVLFSKAVDDGTITKKTGIPIDRIREMIADHGKTEGNFGGTAGLYYAAIGGTQKKSAWPYRRPLNKYLEEQSGGLPTQYLPKGSPILKALDGAPRVPGGQPTLKSEAELRKLKRDELSLVARSRGIPSSGTKKKIIKNLVTDQKLRDELETQTPEKLAQRKKTELVNMIQTLTGKKMTYLNKPQLAEQILNALKSRAKKGRAAIAGAIHETAVQQALQHKLPVSDKVLETYAEKGKGWAVKEWERRGNEKIKTVEEIIADQEEWMPQAEAAAAKSYVDSLTEEQRAANQDLIDEIGQAKEGKVFKPLLALAEATNTRKELGELFAKTVTEHREARKGEKSPKTKPASDATTADLEPKGEKSPKIKSVVDAINTYLEPIVKKAKETSDNEAVADIRNLTKLAGYVEKGQGLDTDFAKEVLSQHPDLAATLKPAKPGKTRPKPAKPSAKKSRVAPKNFAKPRELIEYQSGADRVAAIKGLRKAGQMHMAASVRAVSKKALDELVDHANSGGSLLLDNGAFSAFKSGNPLDEADFNSAMDTFEVVATRMIDKGKLTVIAPDVVGNQDATRRKMSKYHKRLKNLAKQGVNIILPVQKGELNPSELWSDYMYQIEPEGNQAERFIVGIPSNAKAFTTGDILNLFAGKQDFYEKTYIPTRAHLLGMGIHNSKFKAVSDAIPNSVELTADATGLRTNVPAIKEETQSRQEDKAAEKVARDETESEIVPEWILPQIMQWGTQELGMEDDTEVLNELSGYRWDENLFYDSAQDYFKLSNEEVEQLSDSDDSGLELQKVLVKRYGGASPDFLTKGERGEIRTEAIAEVMKPEVPTFEAYRAETLNKDKAGITVTEKVMVGDHEVTAEKDLADAVRDVDAEIKAYNDLMDCLT